MVSTELVGVVRLELTASASQTQHSSHMSYTPSHPSVARRRRRASCILAKLAVNRVKYNLCGGCSLVGSKRLPVEEEIAGSTPVTHPKDFVIETFDFSKQCGTILVN